MPADDFIRTHWSRLTFSPSIPSRPQENRRINPKRMRRAIRKEAREGIGTKAQQALKLQQEQRKRDHKATAKENRERDAPRRFLLRREKSPPIAPSCATFSDTLPIFPFSPKKKLSLPM